MKGQIFVKRLNKSGNYISELDYDAAFMGESNPRGYFKMVIQPIMNCNNNYEIKYIKVSGGYIVSGECYIIEKRTETEIDERIKKYKSDKWENLIQTKVESENELW